MGHREFLLCDNKLAQITFTRRPSDTRMRPPQRGLVQVGLGEAIRAYSWLTGNPGIETLSLDCDLNHERSKEAYS